jgi:hypothetical protein
LTRNELYGFIKRAIVNRRFEVLSALKLSNVSVQDDINNNDLFNLIISSLKEGNGYLLYYLEVIINREQNPKAYSNLAPIVAVGVSLLPSLFGGRKKDNHAQMLAQQNEANRQMVRQYEMIKSQSLLQAQERREELDRQERKEERKSRNKIIFGIVGGAVVIGGLITFMIYKKK